MLRWLAVRTRVAETVVADSPSMGSERLEAVAAREAVVAAAESPL
jgi:hypothetical protein